MQDATQWRKDFHVDALRSCIMPSTLINPHHNNKKNPYHPTSSSSSSGYDNPRKKFGRMVETEDCTGHVYVRGVTKNGRALAYYETSFMEFKSKPLNLQHSLTKSNDGRNNNHNETTRASIQTLSSLSSTTTTPTTFG